jgi:7-cyano-7-deazaguanine synthase
MTKKALVLMSGGLDSTVCLYWAKANFDTVQAITFNYYHRLNREKVASRSIARLAKIKLIEVRIPFIRESSNYVDLKTKRGSQSLQSYIPLRNLIFYSIAGYFAQINRIMNLVGGHNATDGNIFKDATASYFRKLNELILQGLLSPIDCKIILPLKSKSRIDIILMAKALDVPIEFTWSCHREGKFHCGRCYACKQRLEAFKILGVTDPANCFNRKS